MINTILKFLMGLSFMTWCFMDAESGRFGWAMFEIIMGAVMWIWGIKALAEVIEDMPCAVSINGYKEEIKEDKK